VPPHFFAGGLMAEIRFEIDAEDIAVIDGYCSATGKCRTETIKAILHDWSSRKLNEATLILRVAGVTPTLSESERHLAEAMRNK
jgi:hypothetical protein